MVRSDSSREDKALIVALVGTDPQNSASNSQHAAAGSLLRGRKDRPSMSLHERTDPCTGQKRLYASLESSSDSSTKRTTTNRLCEIQLLQPHGCGDDEEDLSHSAFLIKSGGAAQVTGNGKLYTITDVDPLFFLLPKDENSNDLVSKQPAYNNDSSNHRQHQWQPLDQILGFVDPVLRSCLDPNQLLHLYATMKLGPEESFYKFSTVRALTWLKRKQETLEEFLREQQRQRRSKQLNGGESNTSSSDGGAFAAGFYVNPGDLQKKADEEQQQQQFTLENPRDDKDHNPAKEESVQIICSYLSEEWKTRLLNHLEMTNDVLLTSKQQRAKRARSSTEEQGENATTTTTLASSSATNNNNESSSSNNNNEWVQSQAEPPPKQAKKDQPASAGVKRLAKVNTKGMKKMSAFFGVASKKENTKNS